MHSICNPMDIRYLFQHMKTEDGIQVMREAADPSVVCYKGMYYLYASMTCGVFYSNDLVHWQYKHTPDLPIYDYAPDVREINGHLVICASKSEGICDYFLTDDPLSGHYERIHGTITFWDPNLFQDDDGRVYLFAGCSDKTPIWGTEVDAKTLKPIGDRVELIFGQPDIHGFERNAADNLGEYKMPYIEGAWLSKHNGKYYMQYAAPGTEINVYADGVYVSDKPLGPYTYANNNPVSYKPGGFITGAGHGSTFEDSYGNVWHIATMRISLNHMFERRLGLFPAGFDKDGVMFCNQAFGDYPMVIPTERVDPWDEKLFPWMLLSYKKSVTASSFQKGFAPDNAVNEDIRTFWQAASAQAEEWLTVDLGDIYQVNALQINVAEGKIESHLDDAAFQGAGNMARVIDQAAGKACYTVCVSADGILWETVIDTGKEQSDRTHRYTMFENALPIRFVRVTAQSMPYDMPFAISGVRVFGLAHGEKPEPVTAQAERISDTQARVTWPKSERAIGYVVRFGIATDKLYGSVMVYEKQAITIGALNAGQAYHFAVDAFNESGLTKGNS